MSGMAPNDGARPRLVIMIQAHISRLNCIEIKLNVESGKINSQIFSMEFTNKKIHTLCQITSILLSSNLSVQY